VRKVTVLGNGGWAFHDGGRGGSQYYGREKSINGWKSDGMIPPAKREDGLIGGEGVFVSSNLSLIHERTGGRKRKTFYRQWGGFTSFLGCERGDGRQGGGTGITKEDGNVRTVQVF